MTRGFAIRGPRAAHIHGVNETGIYRKVRKEEKWVIALESIEALVQQVGRVIVDETTELQRREHPDIKFTIEIYDDYRE